MNAASAGVIIFKSIAVAGGTTSCYFKTLEQCRAAAAGNGGHCSLNPFYTGPDEAGARGTKKKR
jgi:hypothetical protein